MRYHSLDALRAAMMLLGLVLHAGASYTQQPIGGAWPLRDPQTSVGFDLLLFFIHLFRMPAFFVVAGFFAALLYQRDGAERFVRNRLRRVGLPLVLFWMATVPLMAIPLWLFADPAGAEQALVDRRAMPLSQRPILAHLWFLYDLLIFYGAAIGVAAAIRIVPVAARQMADRAFRAVAASPWGVLVSAAVSAATVWTASAPAIDTSASLVPAPGVLAAYSVFFGFGWMLYRHRDLLTRWSGRWAATLGAGAVASIAYLAVMGSRAALDPAAWRLAAATLFGVSVWLVVLGLFGLFVRHVDRPHPAVRYLADASYWMYLAHLLPITFTAAALTTVDAPAWGKFLLVLTTATVTTLATYHLFVRTTAIGVLLNGRRMPRASSHVAADAV